MIKQMGMIQLPQSFVDCDGYGIAQIQASCFFPHGNTHTAAKIRVQKIFRKTLSLFAKQQVAVIGKFCVGITLGCFGGKTPEFFDIVFGKEVFQVVIDPHIHKMPVVQSCPADSFFGNVKTQRADQMQTCAGGGTSAGNVAAVLGDLRFMQYDIEQNVSPQLRDFPDARYHIVLQKFHKINLKIRFFSTFTVLQ